MHQAAVLGSPIEHSLSPVLHHAGYKAHGLNDWRYSKIECLEADLPKVVLEADQSFRGFSVTMPGKFAALQIADRASDRALAIGSANTLVRTQQGWRADNTDCEGVLYALDRLVGDAEIRRAVVVGAGGTSRAVIWALRERGAVEITVINRSDRRQELRNLTEGIACHFVSYDSDLFKITAAADVIVSTVPADTLRPYVTQLAHAPLLDVIYDPWPTPLVSQTAANGYKAVGGLTMLAGQAFSQFEQFTGLDAPRREMEQALLQHWKSLEPQRR
ncbi:shikimate dehydrogenase [Corynebacterium sp. NML140438]|uniref:shikimate dehydrogenase n=1 Tax=Corynebacterium sp. NML140438 TaxID=1906334 RepID=UPI0008FBA023|nr:shikimate dehydrogenase [Corynebacterium sp. NML140438]OIR42685.1 shikimate dehydrogenase [Corynebacterium sp. NML140438]